MGRISGKPSLDRRTRSCSSENGFWIVDNFSMSERVTVRLIEMTRSDRLSAAIILPSSTGAGGSSVSNPPYSTMIGRAAGQRCRVFRTGVPCVQNNRRRSAS